MPPVEDNKFPYAIEPTIRSLEPKIADMNMFCNTSNAFDSGPSVNFYARLLAANPGRASNGLSYESC